MVEPCLTVMSHIEDDHLNTLPCLASTSCGVIRKFFGNNFKDSLHIPESFAIDLQHIPINLSFSMLCKIRLNHLPNIPNSRMLKE